MKIEDIRIFVALGRRLSFTAAAEELFLTQSALSRRIARMEEELGQKLLIRSTHSVELTEAGRLTLKMGRGILKQYDGYLRQMERLNRGERGTLRFAEIYYAMDRYISEPLGKFKEAYPDVVLDILPMEPTETIHAVLKREADLGFTLFCDGTEQQEELRYVHVANEKIYLFLPEEHPLSVQEVLTPEDLQGATLMFLTGEAATRDYIVSRLRQSGAVPGAVRLCDRASHFNADVLAANAVTFIPECMRELPHRGLIIRPFSEDIQTEYVYIYRRDNQNPTVELYLNLLEP